MSFIDIFPLVQFYYSMGRKLIEGARAGVMCVGRLCRAGENFSKKFLGKAGASSVFDSTTITEFVNQNLLFSFSSSLLTSYIARVFS